MQEIKTGFDIKYGLAIIDMQPDFLNYVCDKNKKKLINAQLDILDVCIKEDIPVAVFEYSDHEPTIKTLTDKIGQCKYYEYFPKILRDGFHSRSDAGYFLNKENVTDLCFTGVYASQCVKQTAQGALDYGFEILTAKDLIFNAGSPFSFWQKYLTESWFDRNGRCLKNHREFLNILNNL